LFAGDREDAMTARASSHAVGKARRLWWTGVLWVLLWPLSASAAPSAAAQWNQVLLDSVKATRASDVVTARALAIVHTAMFDAWAAYDETALSTHTGALWRRPASEHTPSAKEKAIGYAAYRALIDLFPSQQQKLAQALSGFGHDPADAALDPAGPAGIGNLAARQVLYARHRDGANQLGDLREGAYSDWTRWRPVNPPDRTVEPRRFQPPSSVDAQGQLQVRNFGAAHFALVGPFALEAPWEFRPAIAPVSTGSEAEAKALGDEIIRISATLGDIEKATAEFWALETGTETPPGFWAKLAQFVAERRGHSLDADVKLFFVLGNAMLDAAVATIDAKVAWNGARPEAFVKHYWRGMTIEAWGGPNRGAQAIKGEEFRPYLPTSASPEHISGHSSFSAAAATLLKLATGSEALDYEAAVPANSFKGERGPDRDVRFHWTTFAQAADAAGWSRVYGGIHFTSGDRYGRAMGEKVAHKVWRKARIYFGEK
jgi:PAP2 superfamily